MGKENIILQFEEVTGKNKKNCLKAVDFKMQAGYIYGLAGKNGAGKTTLIRTVLQENCCFDGEIYVNGVSIRDNHAKVCEKTGYISEDNNFFEKLSAVQNAKLLSVFYKNFNMECFNEQMRLFNVNTNKIYRYMSRGEKLKFQLAFAMAHSPALYLIDEATAGMDSVFKIEFFDCMRRIMEAQNSAVLITSHIQSELEKNTDYAGFMENGHFSGWVESIDGINQLI